jgi:hypothetical protein
VAEGFDALGYAIFQNLEIIFVESGNGNAFSIFRGGVQNYEADRHADGIFAGGILLRLYSGRRCKKKSRNQATGDGEIILHSSGLLCSGSL